MKVFARYFTEDGVNFRLNTVLQFGDSWDVIGAAVLINPGSARPVGDCDSAELKNLEALTGESTYWKSFSADPTMNQLEKIFNGWYVGKTHPLNGVVLLFNLFNLRDKNLQQALAMQAECNSGLLFSTDADICRMQNVDRFYLGWGSTGKKELREYAEKIFEAVKSKTANYTDPDFNRNPFYHPGYINRSYKRNPATQKILSSF